jgi:hypothetical protein
MRSEINNFDYQLEQAGGLSIVFVAFRHIHCCVWPHQNKTKAHIARALTIQSFSMTPVFVNTMLVFVNTMINRVPINDTDAQNLSLNIFPGFVSREAGLGSSKVLRKDSA